MDQLYDTDILAWSQRQAAVLRDLAARRDLPNELDLDHVAEEIEDVGRSELNAVQSFIRLCLVHIEGGLLHKSGTRAEVGRGGRPVPRGCARPSDAFHAGLDRP